MIPNSQSDQKPAETNDSRITRIGKFLRKTNLDEFPQFINVFLGHMSLIGPRPHMYSDCNKFSSVVKGYKIRNMVKPGITGLAQIRGYHGPALTSEDIFKRFQWDAFYVRNANFWLDMRIIRITVVQRVRLLFYPLGINSAKTNGEEYSVQAISKATEDDKKIIFTRIAKNFFRAGVKIIMLLRSTNN